MKLITATIAFLLFGALAHAAPEKSTPLAKSASAKPTPARMTSAECVVWNRELGFARSVEAHDATAFASYLHAGTVFGAGSAKPTRGRYAVVESWKGIIEGRKFALRWHPGFVSIGGDPNIALSSGPAWTEDFDPASKQRFTISAFTSTWVKDTDGQWRVLFDGAGAPPKPASADDIAKLVAVQAANCPDV
ncbi:MAG: DUF4440 domain-containing protein [Dokdonella sp.]